MPPAYGLSRVCGTTIRSWRNAVIKRVCSSVSIQRRHRHRCEPRAECGSPSREWHAPGAARAAPSPSCHRCQRGKPSTKRKKWSTTKVDHRVCIETGKVVEFHNEDIERLQRDIARAHGDDLEEHSLVLYVRPIRKKG